MDPALCLSVSTYKYEGEFVMQRRARFWTGSRMSNWVWGQCTRRGKRR